MIAQIDQLDNRLGEQPSSNTLSLADSEFLFSGNKAVRNKSKNFKAFTERWEKVRGSTEELKQIIAAGYSIAPAIFKNDYRNKSNFIKAELIMLDIDNSDALRDEDGNTTQGKTYKHELTLPEALEHPLIKDHALMIYTSCSHGQKELKAPNGVWDRFRVIFRLPRIFDDYKDYEKLVNRLIKDLGCDATCKDASRGFFGNSEAEFPLINAGATLTEKWIAETLAETPKLIQAAEKFNKTDSDRLQELLSSADIDISERDIELLSKYHLSGSGFTPRSPQEEIERARDALSYIPQRTIGGGNYHDCLKILMALHSIFPEDTAIDLAEAWSPSQPETSWNISKKMKSFSREDGVGIGTLYQMAKDNGWVPPEKATQLPIGTASLEQYVKGKAAELGDPEEDLEIARAEAKANLEKALDASQSEVKLSDLFVPELASPLSHTASVLGITHGGLITALLPTAASLVPIGTRLHFGAQFWAHPIFFTAGVGVMSSKKSTTWDVVTDPLIDLQEIEEARYESDMQAYEEAKQLDETGNHKLPTAREYVLDDYTPEVMALAQRSQPNAGMLVFADELAGLFNSFDAYKNKKGRERQTWLSLHAGRSLKVNRVGRSRIFCKHTSVSLTGTIQPDILKSLMGDFCDRDGMWGRFLFCNLPRSYSPFDPNAQPVNSNSVLAELYKKLSSPLVESDYSYAPDALLLKTEKYNQLGKLVDSENQTHMAGVYSKQMIYLGRFCLMLHLINAMAAGATIPPQQVSRDTVEAACKLVDYYISQAKQIYLMAPDKGTELTKVMVELVSHPRAVSEEGLSAGWARSNLRSIKTSTGSTGEVKTIFRTLADLGKGRVEVRGRSTYFYAS